jgi:hypothetical protein
MRLCVLFTALVVATGSPVGAQSLADVARQESDRRQTTKPAGKSYTNKDLKATPAPAPAPDAGTTAAAPGSADAQAADSSSKPAAAGGASGSDAKPAAGDGAGTSDTKGEVKDQAYWSKRMNALRVQLDRDQTYAEALQTRVNTLTMDFVNRDDPAQRGKIESDRQKAIDELDRLKKNIEQDRREIQDFEEEARRAGVPPGWLR